MWSYDRTVTIEKPLVTAPWRSFGFYALTGKSTISFGERVNKETVCDALEVIREQNPVGRILLVLDKYGSHVCEYTRKRAHQLGIDLVFLPSGSPHLNPIEQVWKYLKWTMAPIIVEDEDEFHELVKDVFDQVTQRISFAKDWCQKFLDFQKFP